MELEFRPGQTIRIGFAFFSICAFWQMYNNIIPLILTGTFHMDEAISGAIMAADNVFGLFLLPFFGALSDRCKSPMGRRKPFILFGTVAAVLLMVLVPLIDNSYFADPRPGKEALFIAVLAALLLAMGIYRSPAVALMPDLTHKPYRSKGNAIINLMGALGGIAYLEIAAFMYSGERTAGMAHVDYLPIFMIVAGIMLAALFIVMITVDEKRLMAEMAEYESANPDGSIAADDGSGDAKLPREVRWSLNFLLCSIALWFISYNAVETWFTTYAAAKWSMSLGDAAVCLLIANAGAVFSYIPVGHIALKIGRKKSILIGVAVMTACFLAGLFYTFGHDRFSAWLYLIFVLIGMGWALINVNSLPMVLEMCRGSDVGRFTGYYYTFSMLAQIVTPIACGFLLRRVGYGVFFVYAALFMGLAFCTMIFVRHGDSKEGKTGLDAFDFED